MITKSGHRPAPAWAIVIVLLLMAPSNARSADTCPRDFGGLTATAHCTIISLSWSFADGPDTPSGAITYYINCRANGGSTWSYTGHSTPVTTIDLPTTDSYMLQGQDMEFQVVAGYGGCTSKASNVADVHIPRLAASPGPIYVSFPTSNQVRVDWTANGANAYANVYRDNQHNLVAEGVAYANGGVTLPEPCSSSSHAYIVEAISNDLCYSNPVATGQVYRTPDAPVLALPANDAHVFGPSTALTWSGSCSASSYNLQIAAQPASPYLLDTSTSTTSYSWTACTGQYYWRVRSCNTGTCSAFSTWRSFTVTPEVPAPLLPADGASLTSSPVALSWGSASCASNYNLQIASQPSSPYLIDASTPATNYSWTPACDGQYYWRVRSCTGSTCSAFSSWRSFTRGGNVILTQPNDGQTLVPGKPTIISWSAPTSCFATVSLEYSTNNGGSWITIAASTPNDSWQVWTVPNTPTTQGLVRVRVGEVGDVSDIPFRIEPHPTGWVANGIALKFPPGEVSDAVTVPAAGGGAFIVWRKRTGVDPGMYVSRVSATGTFPNGWSYGGKRVAPAGAPGAVPHQVMPDGSGGYYIGFSSDGAAVLQHITSSGATGDWPEEGIVLHSSGGSPRLAPDGSGGVYAAWYGGGVRITRLAATGEFVAGWENGVNLNRSSSSVDVAPGGTAGGVYIVADGFLTRIEGNGQFSGPWSAGGYSIPFATHLRAIRDGQNGVIAAFLIGATSELRMTRRASDSAVPQGWLTEGTILETDVFGYDYSLASDGAGGALVAYATLAQKMIVRRMLPSGSFASGWGTNGVPVSTFASFNKAAPFVVSDGWGGAIVTWQEDATAAPAVTGTSTPTTWRRQASWIRRSPQTARW